jgi:hypothetical protein
MLQQTIRAAKSIVAIVSLRQFGSQEWEQLPRFIAKGTNVRATGVIVTMRDSGPLEQAQLESRLRYIEAVFWPYLDTKKTREKVFLCSTTVGTSMQTMKAFLDEREELPAWAEFWTSSLEPVSPTQFTLRYLSVIRHRKSSSLGS